MYDFIQNLIYYIKTLEVFEIVDLYRNEFTNIDWNPSFPACLIRMESLDTAIIDASGDSSKQTAIIIIYVANRYNPANVANDALQLSIDLFENLKNLNSDDGKIITQDNIKFVASNTGIDIYSIQLTVK